VERDPYTIAQYCERENISRSQYYEEQKQGCGVETYHRGNKVLISEAARRRHREKLEAAAQEERDRRAALADSQPKERGTSPKAAEPLTIAR
jgi:hypothetical protein